MPQALKLGMAKTDGGGFDPNIIGCETLNHGSTMKSMFFPGTRTPIDIVYVDQDEWHITKDHAHAALEVGRQRSQSEWCSDEPKLLAIPGEGKEVPRVFMDQKLEIGILPINSAKDGTPGQGIKGIPNPGNLEGVCPFQGLV
jgi:hypothetical protein